MPDSRTPLEPSLGDPALTAMDVDAPPPEHESARRAESALPPVRQSGASNVLPPRPIVIPEPNRHSTMQTLSVEASSSASTRVVHAPTGIIPELPADWAKKQRQRFQQTYPRYLRKTGRSWPTAAQLTVQGTVVLLDDLSLELESWIKRLEMRTPGRRLSYEQWKGDGLSLEHWAVIARRTIPGAPRCGIFLDDYKTSKPITNAVYDIFLRYLRAYRIHLLVGDVVKNMPAQSTPAISTTASAASAVPVPPNAPAPATAAIFRGANAVAPTSLRDLYTQYYARALSEFLRSKGIAVPTEAERTVCGKVIDLAPLMWFVNGCHFQLGRTLTGGDMAGLAVAHFNFPQHKRYFLGERDWRSFWGSTPEVANGLGELYNKYLRDFHYHLSETRATWIPPLIARAKALGVVSSGSESMQFIQATDIGMVANGESAAARAIGLIADECPGVTGAEDKSLSAQKHFALTLGFSPFVDIEKRVFKRLMTVEPNMIGGERFRGPDLLGDEAKQWVREWKIFSFHHDRALVEGPKHIHETLKDDSESEKLVFMMAAHDGMHIAAGLGAPTEQSMYAARLGFPPRPNVNLGTLLAWNADYEQIWAKFDRLAGPHSRSAQYPLAPATSAKVPPIKVDLRKHRPQSNHKAHAAKVGRSMASLRKSSTWIQQPAVSKLTI